MAQQGHCQYCRTCLRQIVARHFVELTGFQIPEPGSRVRQFARRYKNSFWYLVIMFSYLLKQ